MPNCFRLRFDLAGPARVASVSGEQVLTETGEQRITLSLPHPSAGDASSVIVLGQSYASADAARNAGLRWVAVLQRAFAHLNIGADLGARAARATLFGVEPNIDKQLSDSGWLTDKPGLVVFEEVPWPTFVQRTSSSSFARSPDTLVSAIEAVRRLDVPMSPVEQTAYDLYSSSFSATSFDARFIVLMMALETLIDPQPRDEKVAGHVDQLIAQTKQAGLPKSQLDSLVGSLHFLRQESISQAGRRLVSVLGSRRYMDLEPERFFTTCYGLRSRLVHGQHPRPTRENIESHITHLERLVSDLLSGDLLDVSTRSV
jgi:hypothetical protein